MVEKWESFGIDDLVMVRVEWPTPSVVSCFLSASFASLRAAWLTCKEMLRMDFFKVLQSPIVRLELAHANWTMEDTHWRKKDVEELQKHVDAMLRGLFTRLR